MASSWIRTCQRFCRDIFILIAVLWQVMPDLSQHLNSICRDQEQSTLLWLKTPPPERGRNTFYYVMTRFLCSGVRILAPWRSRLQRFITFKYELDFHVRRLIGKKQTHIPRGLTFVGAPSPQNLCSWNLSILWLCGTSFVVAVVFGGNQIVYKEALWNSISLIYEEPSVGGTCRLAWEGWITNAHGPYML